MFQLSQVQLADTLRSMPSGEQIELRDKSGDLDRMITPREADILAEEGQAVGLANKNGFRRMELIVDASQTHAVLRRRLGSTGRTIAEDCQAVSRRNLAGGGVIFEHIHSEAFSPKAREACR